MRKSFRLLVVGSLATAILFTGCSQSQKDKENITDAQSGKVVELEGAADQYGWMPQMRLTFEGDALKEVYFEYLNSSAEKKSQDEEYNANMESKTGIGVKDAMEKLREQLIAKQDPSEVEVVTGATQTSSEFIEMAKECYDHYAAGKNSANNYGEPESKEKTGDQDGKGQSTESNGQSQDQGTDYSTGGDANSGQQPDSGAAPSEGN